MTELFMLLSELGFSDRALTKSFWLIGTIAAGVVLIVRRQQILPTIKRLNEKCREPRVRDCLIFAPCCALCGAAVYFLVMPFCFSQADTAKIMEEPPPTAKDWILGYLIVYGMVVLAPLMTLWENKPKIKFVPESAWPFLIYMSVPPLGFYMLLAFVYTADIRSLWFVFMPMFQWILCLVPLAFLRWQEIIK